MGKIFEQIQSSFVSKTVEMVWLAAIGLLALIVPADVRGLIFRKLTDFLQVLPLAVYFFGIIVLAITYFLHATSLRRNVKDLRNKLAVLEVDNARKQEHLSMFGLKWTVDYLKRIVSGPFCPACQATLTKFQNDSLSSGMNKGKATTFMYCLGCKPENQFYPTDTNGSPMMLEDARTKLNELLFQKNA